MTNHLHCWHLQVAKNIDDAEKDKQMHWFAWWHFVEAEMVYLEILGIPINWKQELFKV